MKLADFETLGPMLIKIMSRLIDCGYLQRLRDEYTSKGSKRFDDFSVVELLEEASVRWRSKTELIFL